MPRSSCGSPVPWHSSLAYVSPMQFEGNWFAAQAKYAG